MKIVNVIGGLGNQMFQYAFALSLKDKFPNEDILIEVVEDFNKRNETYISYMRNQYNALEKYVVAYCNDNNKYLLGVGGKETGINYKFRKVLSEVISLKRDIISSLAFESKFPVGSSASINAGLFIIALPIDTRCCCPPDNWFGK